MDAPGLNNTPYRFVRAIGRGGMGSVFEVEHQALGRRFVMKVLHESLAHREDFAQRMKSEWRTLARLEHPAIVQVTDAGRTSDGLPYFVMERLDGETLAEALHARGRFPALEAATLMVSILSGLEAAHATGAIHRDIKPQNLFLTARGPKILDFGIAKSKRPSVGLVTRSGVAIGTPRYMAPEQAAGYSVDGRADVYACALVLFEMIAGRDPFSHLSDQAALVGAHISEPVVRLDDISSDVPPPLADLVQRWMAKDAADRPASARLARLELEALLPLLAAAAPRSQSTASTEITVAQRLDESTAGATGRPASLPPPPSSPARTSAPGVRAATMTMSTLEEPPEPAHGLSVTPPPTLEPEVPVRPPRRNRWLIGAVFLFSALAAAWVLLVAGSDRAGHWPPAPVARAAAAREIELTDVESLAPEAPPARPEPTAQAASPAPAGPTSPASNAPREGRGSPRRPPTTPSSTGPGEVAPPAAEGTPLPGSGLW